IRGVHGTTAATHANGELASQVASPFPYTTLNGAITSSDTTITVQSTSNFASAGTIQIDNEYIDYTGKTATAFTGCSRGAHGTTAAAHSTGTPVTQAPPIPQLLIGT